MALLSSATSAGRESWATISAALRSRESLRAGERVNGVAARRKGTSPSIDSTRSTYRRWRSGVQARLKAARGPGSIEAPSSPAHALGERIGQHLSPGGPVVGHVVAPEIQLVRDTLAPEDTGQLSRVLRPLPRALAAADVDRAVVEQREILAVEPRKVRGRVVEEDVVVPEAEEVTRPQVVEPAHRHQGVEEVGPAEDCVRGVKGAEARSGCADPRRVVLEHLPDVRDHFLLHVAGEERLASCLLRERHPVRHPGVTVDAVDAEDGDPPVEDQRLERLDEPHPLGLEEVTGGGGEEEEGAAPGAVADDGHVDAQPRAVPAEDLPPDPRVHVGHGRPSPPCVPGGWPISDSWFSISAV